MTGKESKGHLILNKRMDGLTFYFEVLCTKTPPIASLIANPHSE
jgi:hypothetical protein